MRMALKSALLCFTMLGSLVLANVVSAVEADKSKTSVQKKKTKTSHQAAKQHLLLPRKKSRQSPRKKRVRLWLQRAPLTGRRLESWLYSPGLRW